MAQGKKGTGPRAGETEPSCPRSSKPRRHKTPNQAAKKRQKREQEGSGSRSSFRVRCCISLMGTPLERPSPCDECRRKRYYVSYDAHPDPSRRKRSRDGRGGWRIIKRGYYCEKPPVGVKFRDRAGDEGYCDRVEQGRLDYAFVEWERIRCERAEHMAAQNRA